VNKVVLGIDIGGTNTVYGLVEKSGNILISEQIPTLGHEPADSLISRLKVKVDTYIEDHSVSELAGNWCRCAQW
jgi:glucokinase